MARVNPKAKKKKPHIATPMSMCDGKMLVVRDKSRARFYTDHVKLKIKDLTTDDVLAFRDTGLMDIDQVFFGKVISTTPTEIFVEVVETIAGRDIKHQHRIGIGAVLGYAADYHARVHIVEKIVGGKTYALGYRLDGVGRPDGWLDPSADGSMSLV